MSRSSMVETSPMLLQAMEVIGDRRKATSAAFTIFRSARPRTLVWLVIAYAAFLWWQHSLMRQPINLEYFHSYVSLRCSEREMQRFPQPRSRDDLVQLEKAMRRCQDADVEIDGVWGGITGEPSVRLKVVFDPDAAPEFEHYSVGIDPVLGLASIRYGVTPVLYYLNF